MNVQPVVIWVRDCVQRRDRENVRPGRSRLRAVNQRKTKRKRIGWFAFTLKGKPIRRRRRLVLFLIGWRCFHSTVHQSAWSGAITWLPTWARSGRCFASLLVILVSLVWFVFVCVICWRGCFPGSAQAFLVVSQLSKDTLQCSRFPGQLLSESFAASAHATAVSLICSADSLMSSHAHFLWKTSTDLCKKQKE